MEWERHLGWLWLAWRFHLDDPEPELVEQWQRGHLVPQRTDFLDLERAAGTPTGLLTSIPDLLWLHARRADLSEEPTPCDGVRRDALLEAALAGEATCSEWAELSSALSAGPMLPHPQAEALVRTLLDTLPRGVGHCYRLLRIAALRLLEVPEMREVFVEGIRRCVADVDGPAFLEPIGLLDLIPTKNARSLILDLLVEPRFRRERAYAAWLTTQVWLRDGFDEEDRARVVMAVLTGWRADPVKAEEDLGQLVDVLPEGVRRVLARGGSSGRAEEPDLHPASAGEISETLAGTITTRGQRPLPPGLQELVQTSLFDRSAERRHVARQVLAASPCRGLVGDGVLDLLSAPGTSALVRRRAAVMINNVVTEEHRMRMVPLVRDGDPTVAASCTTALGHIPLSAVSDQEVRRAVPELRLPMGRACLYALGMTGSDGLRPLAAARTAPAWQRRTASWWLEAGPAVTV